MVNVQSGWSIFPWKRNSENYKESGEDLLNAYQTMGLNMSMKIHFFFTFPLYLFPPNLGAVSDE